MTNQEYRRYACKLLGGITDSKLLSSENYKKIIAGALAVVILVVSGVLLFQHNSAPRVEDIYDRMVYLIESSQEVNALIYGCGLPVWEDDSEYVEFMHVYYGLEPAQHYELVTPNAKYFSVFFREYQKAAAVCSGF